MTVAAEDRYHDSPDDLSCRGNLDHHNVTCMAHSDSEGETIDDLEFDARTDGDVEEENYFDEDLLGALDNGVDEATEADEVDGNLL
jgi:hypothetical protein